MKKGTFRRMAAVGLAVAIALQSVGIADVVQAQNLLVRTQSATQMSSDKEAVYVNTYNSSVREHDFDANWKFYLGDASGAEKETYDDSTWENVNLPHDYSIEQEYSKTGEAESAYLLGGTGWYRKHFNLTSDMKGKELRIDFDGVYMNATVWVNGTKLGMHPYGYTAFSFDITDYVSFDTENVITVKVDHQTPSSRWYSGSGIYRDVKLTVMDKVHVDLNGTQVIVSDEALAKDQTNVPVTIHTDVTNAGSETANVTLTHTIYEKGTENSIGTVTTGAAAVAAGATETITANLTAQSPKLWGIGEKNAHLYTITTQVKSGDTVLDTYDTEYGFRYTNYDTDTGFSLNGKNVKLKGVCMHHDQGSLGAEGWYRAIERQVEILQEMGCNSIRVTHNPAASALIDICNAKGILVVEEIFDGWVYTKNGNTYDYAQWFETEIEADNQILGASNGMTWAEFDLKAAINKDKNDPSIIMWSLGNEIQEGTYIYTGYTSVADNLIKWAQEADTTKKLTVGSNDVKNAIGNDSNENIQIANKLTEAAGTSGANYASGWQYDSLHKTYPEWYLYGSETASHINSRGVYYKTDGNNSNQDLTSYDNSAVGWGATASSAWYDVIKRDFVFGEYVWTGFDYLGEPTPWNGTSSGVNGTWPSPKNSYFGIVDTAGLPKDNYYFYMSQWNDEVTTLHVLPAWNEDVVVSSGKVPIVVYSNAAEVELIFIGENGQEESLGRKKFTEKTTDAGFTYQIYEGEGKDSSDHKNLYLTWYKAFEKGTIKAVAYDENGKVIQETIGRSSVTTTGEEAKLQASADRTTITADGKDLTYITVDVTDENGNIVPDADNNVRFIVEGDGVLVGVDNGKQDDHQSYQDDNRNAYNGSLVAIVQSTKNAGSFTVTARADGLTSAKVAVTTKAAETDAAQEKQVSYFYMARNYYVKQGETVTLPGTIETYYTDGSKEELNVVWDQITQTTGTFGVNGTVDGTYQVSVVVNMIDQVTALLNYSTTTPLGQAPVLASSRPAVMADGTILDVSFPVTWEEIDEASYAQAGTFTVNGTSNVLGTMLEVTATVRVQEETITVGGSVDNPLTLTQNIPEGSQSGSLDAVWDQKTDSSAFWSNESYTQAGNPKAEITFGFATQQRIGKMIVHFYDDGASAAYPDAGKTEIYYSNAGTDGPWTKLEAEETIGEASNGVKAYTYSFAPLNATYLKFNITNAAAQGTPYTAITEIEILGAKGSFNTNTKADITSMTVNGTEVTESELEQGVYYTLASTAVVTAASDVNASITVLPETEEVIRLIAESEDHLTRKTFTVYLNREKPMDPSDSSKDYPVDKITYSAGSEEANYGSSEEGVISLAFDGKEDTLWHSEYYPSWDTADCEDHLWVQFDFKETVNASAIRYLARGANGDITGYRVEAKTTVDSNWEKLTSGTWERGGQQWNIAQFTPTDVVVLRLVVTSSYADSGNNKYASARELRVVGTGLGDSVGGDDTAPEYYPNENITPSAYTTRDSKVEDALDGDTSTFWQTDWDADNTGNLWYQMVLAEETTIDQLQYYPRYQGENTYNGEQNGFVSRYHVEVSKTGESGSWKTVASNAEAESGLTPENRWYEIDFDKAATVKYVRFVADTTLVNGSDNTNNMSIAELRLRLAEADSDNDADKDPDNGNNGDNGDNGDNDSNGGVTTDKTTLNTLIETAKTKKEADYTSGSWKTFQTALASAEEVSANADAAQTEVDAKADALRMAMEQLTKKADLTELNELLAYVKTLKEADYTAKTWQDLQNVVLEAEGVSEDSAQTSVDIIVTALENAIDALEEPADDNDPSEDGKPSDPDGKPNDPSDGSGSQKPDEKPEISAGDLVEGSKGDSSASVKEWTEGDGKLAFTASFEKEAIEEVTVNGKVLVKDQDYIVVENSGSLLRALFRASFSNGVTIKLTESFLATLEKGKTYTLCVTMKDEFTEEASAQVFSANFAVAAAAVTPDQPSGDQTGTNQGSSSTGSGSSGSGSSGSSSKSYTVLTEAGSYNLNQGGTYSIRIDADHGKFKSVKLDGNPVDESNYEHWSGSTWIRFSEEFMKKQSLGERKIEVKFTDGSAVTTVKIVSYDVPTEIITVQNQTTTTTTAPGTGDASNAVLWSILLAACGVTMFGIRAKKQEEE